MKSFYLLLDDHVTEVSNYDWVDMSGIVYRKVKRSGIRSASIHIVMVREQRSRG